MSNKAIRCSCINSVPLESPKLDKSVIIIKILQKTIIGVFI